jgi:DNA-binding response OmpR family regulator
MRAEERTRSHELEPHQGAREMTGAAPSIVSQVGSSWHSPNLVFCVGLITQERVGRRWLTEARAALESACASGSSVRFVEVNEHPDLWVLAGTSDWAEASTRQSRGVGDPTPIVVLNVPGESTCNARILDAGADDCLPCPFDPAELRARVQAVMRRQAGPLRHGTPLAIDRGTLRIRVRDVEAKVSPRQLEVFSLLAKHRERWVHSEEIIAAVSGTHHAPTTSLVRVQVHALRKALAAERHCIRCNEHKSYMLTLATSTPRPPRGNKCLTAK